MNFIKNYNFIKNNKIYIKLIVSLLVVVLLAMLFDKAISNTAVINFMPITLEILSPFIYGFIIAYVLNPILRLFENKVFLKFKYFNEHKKVTRPLAITVTYVLFIGIVLWITAYIIPEVIENIQNVFVYIKSFDISQIEELYNHISRDGQNSVNAEISQYIINLIEDVMQTVMDSVKYIPNMLNTVISGTVNIASGFFKLVMGLVIAFYMLSDKEAFAAFLRKTLYVFLSEKTGNRIITLSSEANKTFEKFFVGKLLDSVIIGILFFLGCLILKPSYSLLLSIIIGITNMIPYFGPFIGAVPVVFITALSNPLKAVWIALFILLLQQFDGIILGPKILGDSIGLKPIGIIFAIIIGGALFGPLGMFFGVPLFAVLVTTITKFIDLKYLDKQNTSKED